jgi:choline dehydrogenase-like flavoprotein
MALASPASARPATFDVRSPEYRAGLALAEAIIPGSSKVPAADEATYARSMEVMQDFHPAFVRTFNVGVRALDAAAVAYTGHRFHELSAAKQEELMLRWARDPVLKAPLAAVSLIFKFVHFDRPEVYGTLGGKLNVVKNLEQPRWLSQVQRADEIADDEIECEVIVVGTGAGGAVVGRELAERGLAVVFLEEGEHHRRDVFDGRAVEAHKRFYRGAFTVGNSPMPIFIGRLMGGSTAINGGTSLRTPDWVLERWADAVGSDDFSPASMRPYFEKVERFLQIGPSPLDIIGPISGFVKRGCDALGWSHQPIPRNAPGCDGKGFCDFGCRTDARLGTNLSYMPAALGRGALCLTGARVDQVLLEGGRAVGVEAVTPTGRKVRVRGKAVVLAGGAIPTPLLLLKQGLANSSGEVGKNLSLHPSTGFAAIAPERMDGAHHVPQGYGFDQFLRDGILVLTAQPDYNVSGVIFPFAGQRLMEVVDRIDHLAGFGILVSDAKASGRVWRDVGGLPAVTYNLDADDVRRMHQGMIVTSEMALAAGAKHLYPFVVGYPRVDGAKGLDTFRREKFGPSDFVWTSYHPLGTCRMGPDPERSVVDLDHAAHDVPGLFVVDGSTVRGPIGVNPQLTIMAMATRAAERIADRIG